MPSKSKSQQRLFGWVHACQKGTAKNCPPNISKIAGSISNKDAEDFAKTKHKNLPEKKKKKLKTYREFLEEQIFQENLNAAQKGMASTIMTDPAQAKELAKQAGIPVEQYYKIMFTMIDRAEKKMIEKNIGDPNKAYEQAIQSVFAIYAAAADQKRQWSKTQQAGNIENNIENNQKQSSANKVQPQGNNLTSPPSGTNQQQGMNADNSQTISLF